MVVENWRKLEGKEIFTKDPEDLKNGQSAMNTITEVKTLEGTKSRMREAAD